MKQDLPYKLTSVKIIRKKYFDFKTNIINNDITLQKIVNRCIDLYLTDKQFKNKINDHKIDGLNNLKY